MDAARCKRCVHANSPSPRVHTDIQLPLPTYKHDTYYLRDSHLMGVRQSWTTIKGCYPTVRQTSRHHNDHNDPR